jgi:biotin transporter BioY
MPASFVYVPCVFLVLLFGLLCDKHASTRTAVSFDWLGFDWLPVIANIHTKPVKRVLSCILTHAGLL